MTTTTMSCHRRTATATASNTIFLLVFYQILVLVLVLGPGAAAAAAATDGSSYDQLSSAVGDERRLRSELFVRRLPQTLNRPFPHANRTAIVDASLTLQHISNLDPHTNTLSLTAWLKLEWMDIGLAWTPQDYGGIKVLRVDHNLVWKPNMTLVNSVSRETDTPLGATSVLVMSEGRVIWVPPANMDSYCAADVRRFPFDSHSCDIEIGAWTQEANVVSLKVSATEVDAGSYALQQSQGSQEWHVTSTETVVKRQTLDCCYYLYYSVAVFTLHLSRRASYYQVALLLPVVMSVLVALALFWAPPMSRERIWAGGVNCLVLLIFLLHVNFAVPHNANGVPCIVLFCGVAMVFSGVAVGLTVVTLSMSRRRSVSPTPAFVRSFLRGWVSRVCCLPPAGNADSDSNKSDWVPVAMIIDRICFVVFVVAFVVVFALSFP